MKVPHASELSSMLAVATLRLPVAECLYHGLRSIRVDFPHPRLIRLTRGGTRVRIGGIENEMNRASNLDNRVDVVNCRQGLP